MNQNQYRKINFFGGWGIRRLISLLFIDGPVIYSILGRAWGAVAGLLVTIAVAIFLTLNAQGYFFTFLSLLNLQILVELGLGAVVVQFVAHEWSFLQCGSDGRVSGDPIALSRIRQIARLAAIWYAAGAAIYIGVLLCAGQFILASKSGAGWLAPWLTLVGAVGLDFLILPLIGVLEGCRRLSEVYRYRLFRAMINWIVVIAGLSMGLGLWAVPAGVLAGVSYSVVFVLSRRAFLQSIFMASPETTPSSKVNWRREMLPMQAQVGVAALSAVAIFYMFTPLIFRFVGPEAAGRMAMTWNMILSVAAVSQAIVQPKAAILGSLVSQGDFAGADKVVMRTGALAIGACALATVVLFCGLAIIPYIMPSFANRILGLPLTLAFMVGNFAIQAMFPIIVYGRAFKRDPMMAPLLGMAILVVTLTAVLVPRWGIPGAATALNVGSFFFVPASLLVLLRIRRRRQAAPVVTPGDAWPPAP